LTHRRRGIGEAIEKRIPDARVILFGSRARGEAPKHSDVDLIVVSSVFKGMHFTDRASYVLRILGRGSAARSRLRPPLLHARGV